MFNDDTIVDADTIPGHLHRIRQDPTARVAYLGRFDWHESLIDSPWRRLLAGTSMIFFWDQMQAGQRYGFRHFWTANLSVRTDLVRDVGGFDEAFPHAIHEDIELGWRLERDFGLRVEAVPTIRAWHDHAITPENYFDREHLSGKVAERARAINPAFCDAVWGWLTDPADTADRLARLFAASMGRVRRLLEDWSVPSDDQPSPDALLAAYLAHLPLKRMIFCQGFAGRPLDELWNVLETKSDSHATHPCQPVCS